MFGVRDTGNFFWWNLGGWNNTQSGIEKAVNGSKSLFSTTPTAIETGRDCHIKIQVAGRKITTWLDGEKINEFTDSATVEPLYQVVSRDAKSGDLVLKVVNVQPATVRAKVDLGRVKVADKATVTTLTGNLQDVNSIAESAKVAPVEQRAGGFGASFGYDFPAGSVTFIRLDAKGQRG
jgi:alpha-L-arabinofuranosidase